MAIPTLDRSFDTSYSRIWEQLIDDKLAVSKEKLMLTKSEYQRILQNLILPEYDNPEARPEIVCELSKIAATDVIVVVARNSSGVMHTFAEDVRDFPSPALLTKMRLFK